ncbi:AMP-binding protein [Amycolatopsis thermophila]|uniref:AMP-binding protein n=1 Tax=Amycolatopsis thermophila TaxID=206084 RepID=UPI0027D8BC99|nr:AMP-binding protein [Amycolatopsis thermophila]
MSPHAIAVRHGGTELTYAQLFRRVARLAHGLRAAGVRPGDRVAYLGPNHPAYLETLFACGQAGAVFVPLELPADRPGTRLRAGRFRGHRADPHPGVRRHRRAAVR